MGGRTSLRSKCIYADPSFLLIRTVLLLTLNIDSGILDGLSSAIIDGCTSSRFKCTNTDPAF